MLKFHKFLHTMYKCVLNSAVDISMMFAKYFEYYTSILRGPFFVNTLYRSTSVSWYQSQELEYFTEAKFNCALLKSTDAF